jgi:hypothetical protein
LGWRQEGHPAKKSSNTRNESRKSFHSWEPSNPGIAWTNRRYERRRSLNISIEICE